MPEADGNSLMAEPTNPLNAQAIMGGGILAAGGASSLLRTGTIPIHSQPKAQLRSRFVALINPRNLCPAYILAGQSADQKSWRVLSLS